MVILNSEHFKILDGIVESHRRTIYGYDFNYGVDSLIIKKGDLEFDNNIKNRLAKAEFLGLKATETSYQGVKYALIDNDLYMYTIDEDMEIGDISNIGYDAILTWNRVDYLKISDARFSRNGFIMNLLEDVAGRQWDLSECDFDTVNIRDLFEDCEVDAVILGKVGSLQLSRNLFVDSKIHILHIKEFVENMEDILFTDVGRSMYKIEADKVVVENYDKLSEAGKFWIKTLIKCDNIGGK